MSIVDFYSWTQINLFISLTSFSFYLSLLAKEYVSTDTEFTPKNDLQVARDQVPSNIPVTYFLFHFYPECLKGSFISLKNKMFEHMTGSQLRFSYLLF